MSGSIRLGEIAHARAGDKGDHANIGVIAYNQSGYEYLRSVVTEQMIGEFFVSLQPSRVERFELPGIHALNFLLHDALQGGASLSLRTDTQGKILGLAVLEMPIPRPENLTQMQNES